MADPHRLDELLPVLTGVLIEQVATGRPGDPGRPVTAHDVAALSLVSIAQSLALLADTVKDVHTEEYQALRMWMIR
jgi:hypothetical protein